MKTIRRSVIVPILLTMVCCPNLKIAEAIPGIIILKNGEIHQLQGFTIQVIPAYNIVHKRSTGELYHPEGIGNGYVITFGDKKIYVAGDTENIPEMAQLSDIYCAFLPMNLPYTMSPAMVSDAVRMFNPVILYPYHFGNTDTDELIEIMKDEKDCEFRIRKLN
jgi:L-ascorbate metabolism protein UlaG (beta-lactamase superfamily)